MPVGSLRQVSFEFWAHVPQMVPAAKIHSSRERKPRSSIGKLRRLPVENRGFRSRLLGRQHHLRNMSRIFKASTQASDRRLADQATTPPDPTDSPRYRRLVHHVRVDHRRLQPLMPQQRLHLPHVVPRLQQMGREAMAKCVRRHPLADPRRRAAFPHRPAPRRPVRCQRYPPPASSRTRFALGNTNCHRQSVCA